MTTGELLLEKLLQKTIAERDKAWQKLDLLEKLDRYQRSEIERLTKENYELKDRLKFLQDVEFVHPVTKKRIKL